MSSNALIEPNKVSQSIFYDIDLNPTDAEKQDNIKFERSDTEAESIILKILFVCPHHLK